MGFAGSPPLAFVGTEATRRLQSALAALTEEH